MLEQAYAVCRKMVRSAGTNFYYGMRLLPVQKRSAMHAVYAWSRICDDAVDEFYGDEARARLGTARDLLERALGPGHAVDRHPVVQALGDAIERFRLPEEPFFELIQGMLMDVEPRVYRTFAEVRQYCERVAGTIGQICVGIFGYSDPAACAMASDMGVALQITNILRDLREDVERGRIYLPGEELAEAGYTLDDLRSARRTPPFYALMEKQARRAHEYYGRAAALFPLIEEDARLCANVLYGIYYELLLRIENTGFDVFSARVRVPTSQKLRLVGALLWQRQIG